MAETSTYSPLVSSTPALFEKYHSNNVPPVDEWVLSEAMAGDTRPGGGLSQIESHYKTFIVMFFLKLNPERPPHSHLVSDRERLC